MTLQGDRITISKSLYSGPIALRVDVEAVIPVDAPGEPCLELDTVRFLDHLQQLADAGDVDELEKHGEVYVRRSA